MWPKFSRFHAEINDFREHMPNFYTKRKKSRETNFIEGKTTPPLRTDLSVDA